MAMALMRVKLLSAARPVVIAQPTCSINVMRPVLKRAHTLALIQQMVASTTSRTLPRNDI